MCGGRLLKVIYLVSIFCGSTAFVEGEACALHSVQKVRLVGVRRPKRSVLQKVRSGTTSWKPQDDRRVTSEEPIRMAHRRQGAAEPNLARMEELVRAVAYAGGSCRKGSHQQVVADLQ